MIVCDVCPRACHLDDGETGFCGVRKNANDKNRDALYRLSRTGLPLQHPGYILAFPGCNLKCWFCLWPFLSRPAEDDIKACSEISESEAVDAAGESRQLVFLGGEPSLHYEYILEASRLCRERGITTIMYTSGYISAPLMMKFSKTIDYLMIGVKASLSERHYHRMNADSGVVRRSIKIASDNCPHLGIENVVGPDLNPDHQDNVDFAVWLRDNVKPNIRIDVESQLEPQTPTEDSKETKMSGGADADSCVLRVQNVAETFAEYGLTNVWILEFATRFPLPSVSHIPSWIKAIERRLKNGCDTDFEEKLTRVLTFKSAPRPRFIRDEHGLLDRWNETRVMES